MALRITRQAIQRRLYSSAAPKSTAKLASTAEVQVGKASNGMRLVAQENDSPLARVVCAVKAGSRYEEVHQRGVSHCLRVTSDLTQREARAFRFTREIQQMGGNVTCTASREHLLYTLEISKSSVEAALPYMAGMVAHQSFRPWEISDSMPKLEYEILSLSEQPERRVVERAHDAAYRETGLGRSLYAPAFMIGEFSPDLLREYVHKNFTPDRVSISAIGLGLNDLQSIAGKFDIGQTAGASDSAAKYFGGEVRENSEDLIAYTVLVGEGASCGSEEVWAYAVLEQLLGAGPQIKWASNTSSNMLNAAVSKQTQDPYHLQAFSVSYSDSGLFGISAVTVPENSDTVLRTAVEQIRSIASGLPNKEALQGAKNRVKSTVAFQNECAGDMVESRAMELLTAGQVSDLQATLKVIDSVSASAVQNAAKKLIGGKLSMASIGEIYNVPYVDQL